MTDKYQDGAEAMREACARECEKQVDFIPHGAWAHGFTEGVWRSAKAIRALKVEEVLK